MDAERTIKISRETERDLRRYSAVNGLTEDDLTRLVDEAVKEKLLREVLAKSRKANADLSSEALEDLVNEAVKTIT
ncbi:MAG: ribbon-helix-helix domain-containing protein [Trueperaceae bacterium]|nr:ribbon-helix-helix domain-containing protein [Trueperaceae bacterium]